MKIGIIGGGAMGEAVASAVIRSGVANAPDVCIADIAAPRLDHLRRTYGVRTAEANREAAAGAEFLVFATKPQDFDKAAADLKGRIDGMVVLSIMAGVPMSHIAGSLGSDAVVRAMPNTPAQVGEGMSVWTASKAVSDAGREGAARIFASMGAEAFVPDERYLDMATGLSGSGPAYVFLFIEALTDAGVHVGLSRDLAAKMALQTVLGSAIYAKETGRHPAELRNQVTSPAGTTAAALRAMETGGFRAAVLEGVIAAFERSRALGQGDAT